MPKYKDSKRGERILRITKRIGPGRWRLAPTAVILAIALCVFPASAEPWLKPPSEDRESIERMVGRMLIVGFDGAAPDDAPVRSLTKQIALGHVGGVLFLRRNIVSGEGVRALTGHLAMQARYFPLIVAIDQEGGRVQRLTRRVGFPETPAARLVAQGTVSEAEERYGQMARELRRWGFNLNLGPVVDLAVSPSNQVIAGHGRSYSSESSHAAEFAAAFVTAHRAAGVGTSLKHYPGHGSSRADSHVEFVDISDSWRETEVEPYSILAQRELIDTVMVGHLHITPFGVEERKPASLSQVAIDDWLRQSLGKDTIVIADDLDMGAVRNHYPLVSAVEEAVRAGNDLIIHANTFDHHPELASIIVREIALRASTDPELLVRIRQANHRIGRAKWLYSEGRPTAATLLEGVIPGLRE